MAQDSFTIGFTIDARHYDFQPKSDITAYELARALPPIFSNDVLALEALPPEVRRHFTLIEPKEIGE